MDTITWLFFLAGMFIGALSRQKTIDNLRTDVYVLKAFLRDARAGVSTFSSSDAAPSSPEPCDD